MSKWCMNCKHYLKDEHMCVCIGGRHCSDFMSDYSGCEKFEDKETETIEKNKDCELATYCLEDGEPVIPCSNHDCPIRDEIEEE